MESKRQLIAKLNRLDLNQVDYDEIKDLVNELVSGVHFEFQTLAAGQLHFRARRINQRPLTISALMNPPDDRVTDFQRCNPPKRSTMYCSSCTHSAMREISASEGDVIYLSHWKQNCEFLVAKLTPTQSLNHLDVYADMVSSFLETKFSQPIHDVFSSQYKITAAVFEMMTGPIAYEFGPELHVAKDVRDQGVHALMYCSIANRQKSHCIAFRPEFAKRHLDLQYVEERVVTKVNFDSIEYDISGGTYVLNDPNDGDIFWAEGRQICGISGIHSENELLAALESRRRDAR